MERNCEENLTFSTNFMNFNEDNSENIEKLTNNLVQVIGEIVSDLKYSHEIYNEKFYSFFVKIPRLSEHFDEIPVIISEKFVKTKNLKSGDIVFLQGQFRSHNNFTKIGNKLLLSIFVKSVKVLENDVHENYINSVYLNGYICKLPIYRTTPFGREITDILLAVNRSYNKSDYIPCIAWGKNAKLSSAFSVGENLKIWGRVQSREYQKKISETEFQTKKAYEISISKIEVGEKSQA
jgi:single-stranded DNA-binding protein